MRSFIIHTECVQCCCRRTCVIHKLCATLNSSDRCAVCCLPKMSKAPKMVTTSAVLYALTKRYRATIYATKNRGIQEILSEVMLRLNSLPTPAKGSRYTYVESFQILEKIFPVMEKKLFSRSAAAKYYITSMLITLRVYITLHIAMRSLAAVAIRCSFLRSPTNECMSPRSGPVKCNSQPKYLEYFLHECITSLNCYSKSRRRK